MARKKRISELNDAQRAGLWALVALQVALAVSAWADLAGRPASKVNGSKGRWAAIIVVNFIGPILYFTRGRR